MKKKLSTKKKSAKKKAPPKKRTIACTAAETDPKEFEKYKKKGRPTLYNDETIPKTLYYIENFEDLGHAMPSIAGLAVYLGTCRETIRDWSTQEEKKAFSAILGKLSSRQELTLFNSGLYGTFNSAITKLALGKHGYHEKVDNTLGGPDGKPLEVQWIVNPVRSRHPEEEPDDSGD